LRHTAAPVAPDGVAAGELPVAAGVTAAGVAAAAPLAIAVTRAMSAPTEPPSVAAVRKGVLVTSD
jgi:hypothetical protein